MHKRLLYTGANMADGGIRSGELEDSRYLVARGEQSMARLAVSLLLLVPLCGCGIEATIFPFLGPQPLAELPAPLGPYAFTERSIRVDNLGDGQPGIITVFEPVDAEGPRPTLVWVQGINSEPYYQQSFHEYMASWGYIEVVPATRPMNFLDPLFNKRITDIANHAFSIAAEGAHGLACDSQRMALGGYSAGGSMAAFAAAGEPRAKALAMWVPAQALIWQGVSPSRLLPRIQVPSLFLLPELEISKWPLKMQGLMTESAQTVIVIAGGTHVQFQEPTVSDSQDPAKDLTVEEQMAQALPITRAFLDEKMAVTH